MSTSTIDLPQLPTIGRWHTIVAAILALLLALMWLAGYGPGGHACIRGVDTTSSAGSTPADVSKAAPEAGKGVADAGGAASGSGGAVGNGAPATSASTAAGTAAVAAISASDASARPAPSAPAEAGPATGEGVAPGGPRPSAKLYFDLNKSTMPTDDGGLGEVITFLKAHPETKVVLSGYHDPSGNAMHNVQLALNRARSVRQALEKAGVPYARIVMAKPQETTGTGNDAEARRVEVTVQR